MSSDAVHAASRAVLLVGHGTIEHPDQVPEFLRRIRHGRPATDAFVAEIQRRYREIGRSPLLDVTARVARALEARLGIPCRVAMRFWEPLVADVLRDLHASGVRNLCILPLAPYSVGVYVDVVREALRGLDLPVDVTAVSPYGVEPSFVRAHAARIEPFLAGRRTEDAELVLSAHSLPLRVLASGDAYQREFEASAAAVARAVGREPVIAYQSQGEGGGEWLGPTLEAVFARAQAAGKRTVVVAPLGFLSDHVETLYDLDVEAATQARALGLEFVRVPALNDDPLLTAALAELALRASA